MTILRTLQVRAARWAIAPAAFLLLLLPAVSTPARAADYPQTQISNGPITAKIYLPDAKSGFYRSTRFDWSGAVYSLEYKGHNFYGSWFDSIDPTVINWVYRDGKIVSGPCSGLWGPVDEFQTPLGFDEAPAGGAFIKIGVGVLRKSGDKYNRFVPYDVLNSGKWTVKKHKDSVEFQQVLSDPASGYAYVYRKVVRLIPGKPEMVIERSLKNTGKREIESDTYDHNFMVIDKQAPGPDFTFQVPFQIQSTRPPNPQQAKIEGNRIVYQKQLSGEDQVAVFIQGFSNSPADSKIAIADRNVGAGVRIAVNRPLERELLWSIRTVLAVEPYVAIDVQPGAEFAWANTYDYYTTPAGQ
ncbi:MAG: hypothetical protein ACLGP3_01265 [Acidobacteriota bacterium]